MGHYRAEMISEKDENERVKRIRENNKRITKVIDADIKKRGMADVLREALSDPEMYLMNCRAIADRKN